MIFFTADTHFGHENIIKYCNRPFKSLEQMNDTIIKNWNSIVRDKDTVIVAGDFCFKNTSNKGEGTRNGFGFYVDKLNGHKVFLQGNHDKHNGLKTGFKSVSITLHKQDIFITHRPSDLILGYDIHLVGHVHEKWKHKYINNGERQCLIINVGVDVWNFMPIKIENILHYIKVIEEKE